MKCCDRCKKDIGKEERSFSDVEGFNMGFYPEYSRPQIWCLECEFNVAGQLGCTDYQKKLNNTDKTIRSDNV